MFPDHTGSDVDYYERLNPSDPGHRYCPHGIDTDAARCCICAPLAQDEATCNHGRTVAEPCRACEDALTEAMGSALVRAMDRILGGGK